MKKILLLGIFALLINTFGIAQKQKGICISFYNVENLFDTIDNPNTRDNDFLPNGKLKWNSERYTKKLHAIAEVLGAIPSKRLPSIIGLCEVENRTVIEDLIQQKSLRKGKYRIAHADSPDRRGIDCALIYNKSQYKPINTRTIPIQFPWNKDYKTRDILYVKGTISRKDTLHIFVNHWPSRRGGQKKSEKNRVFVAQQLKLITDSLLNSNPNANIIIMGDFNDEPSNRAVQEILNAPNTKEALSANQFHNLMYALHLQEKGSYNYRGTWNMLDNILISPSLLDASHGYHTTNGSGKVFKENWFSYHNRDKIWVPSRTFGGPKYYGGYSDHYPVYFFLYK